MTIYVEENSRKIYLTLHTKEIHVKVDKMRALEQIVPLSVELYEISFVVSWEVEGKEMVHKIDPKEISYKST